MEPIDALLQHSPRYILPVCHGCAYCSHYDRQYSYCEHPQIGGPIPIIETKDCHYCMEDEE